jgi:hypothetical protein
MNLKDETLAKTDFNGYYSEALGPLKVDSRGQAMTLCPFHQDTNPSLSINTETGQFHCFACEAGGSVFDFHMRRYRLEFRPALLELARRAGIEVNDNGKGYKSNNKGNRFKASKNKKHNQNLLNEIPSIIDELVKSVGLHPLSDQLNGEGLLSVEPINRDVGYGIKAYIVIEPKHEKLKDKLGYYIEIANDKVINSMSFFQFIASHDKGKRFVTGKDVYQHYAKKLGKEPVSTHNYVDTEGKLLYQVLRYRNELTGEKKFRQRRPDGKGGWIWNLESVERVPYNLFEVIKADLVCLHEGEKDCDNNSFFVASCNSGGAGGQMKAPCTSSPKPLCG